MCTKEEIHNIFRNKVLKDAAFLKFYERYMKFTPQCRAIIFGEIIKYWSIITDLIALTQIDKVNGKQFLEVYLTEDYIENTVKKNVEKEGLKLPLLNFYKNYTTGLWKYAKEKIPVLLETDIEKAIDCCVELVNIRYLELKGLKFTCKHLKKFEDYCDYAKDANCYEFNSFIIQLVPEYLLDTSILDGMAKAIVDHIKPNSLQVLVDFSNIKNRLKEKQVAKYISLNKLKIKDFVEVLLEHFGGNVYGYEILDCLGHFNFKGKLQTREEVCNFGIRNKDTETTKCGIHPNRQRIIRNAITPSLTHNPSYQPFA